MRKNILSRFAVLAVCTFVLQGLFWGLPSLVVKAAGQETDCSDGIDNDGNGLIDCADPACQGSSKCPNIIIIETDDMGWGDMCVQNPNSRACKYECTTPVPDDPDKENCKNVYFDCDPVAGVFKEGCKNRTSNNTLTLDTLANQGVRLTNFYAPTPICTPSRAALMTGRDPRRYGIRTAGGVDSFPASEKFLAKVLLEHGYKTAIIGKWDFGKKEEIKNEIVVPEEIVVPWERGFEYNYIIYGGVDRGMNGICLVEKDASNLDPPVKNYVQTDSLDKGRGYSQYKYCKDLTRLNFWQRDLYVQDGKDPFRNSYDIVSKVKEDKSLTEILTDKAIKYISDHRTAPFFLYLAHVAPHTPADIHLPGAEALAVHEQCYKQCDNKECISECEYKTAYPKVINEIDTQLDRLRKCLDGSIPVFYDPINPLKSYECTITLNKTTTNIADNTIIIFTSDNGPYMGTMDPFTSPQYFFERDSAAGIIDGIDVHFKGAKKTSYEGGVRVPFIAYWKNGNWTNRVLSQPADMMDVFATLVNAAVPNYLNTYEKSVDGQDIGSVFSEGNQKSKDVFISWYEPMSLLGETGAQTPYHAIRSYCAPSDSGCDTKLNDYKLYYDEYFTSPLAMYYLLPSLTNNVSESSDLLNESGHAAKKERLQEKMLNHNSQLGLVHYLPSIKDDGDSVNAWKNFVTVVAKDAVTMDAKLKVYDMTGTLKGTYTYSTRDNNPNADEASKSPLARVAARPSYVVGHSSLPSCNPESCTVPVAVEGSMIIETSVPSIVNTNTIVNNYKGFDIYEAPKPRSRHLFSQNWDGAGRYEVYILVQNIYDEPRSVTIQLLPKDTAKPDTDPHRRFRNVMISPHATYKVRPIEIAGTADFNGSVLVFSNLVNPESGTNSYYDHNFNTDKSMLGDGLGSAIPVLNRNEAGKEALTIYESAAAHSFLYFPYMKDGKFGGTVDYQNNLSVVNPNPVDSDRSATITIVLYNNSGTEEGRLPNFIIPAGGKVTWRPSWIKGDGYANCSPNCPDFQGSIVVYSNIDVVGQTNVLYPGINSYGVDAFAIYESAIPSSALFFPKAFDNLFADGRLFDNYAYIQNPDATPKTIKIELFNNDGSGNGNASRPNIVIGPYATHVFRPRDLVTDGSGTFRGSVKVTEANGKNITGVFKYEVHRDNYSTSIIDAVTVFRSMGQ